MGMYPESCIVNTVLNRLPSRAMWDEYGLPYLAPSTLNTDPIPATI